MPSDDPWEEINVEVHVTVPRWMVDLARKEYDDPTMTADDLVAMWIENMEANTYDCARDDGTMPDGGPK